jgi:cytoskeleton protein RodZ
MGELPPSERARRGISRWLIPLVLVALIGAAALYELARQDGGLRLPGLRDDAPATAPADPVMPPAMSGGGTPLPNPLTGGDAAAPAPAAAQPAGASSEAGMLPTGQDIAPSSAATLPPPAPATASVEATLVISYRAPAWTEVRDGNGERLVVGTGTAGSTRTISGTPPFDVVIGNVGKTTITWRGEPVDLSPYLKQNVARMRLQ